MVERTGKKEQAIRTQLNKLNLKLKDRNLNKDEKEEVKNMFIDLGEKKEIKNVFIDKV